MVDDTSKQEILEAIIDFSEKIDKRFDNLEGRFDNLEGRFDNLEGRFDNLENRVGRIEATMVTKDYLDEKLFDLRGDIISVIRKEDSKLKALVEILMEKKVLTKEDEKRICSMEPFPQLYA